MGKVSNSKSSNLDFSKVNIKSLIQAILFVEEKPINLNRLAQFIPLKPMEIKNILDEIQKDFDKLELGVQLNEIAEGYQLSTRANLGQFLKEFYNKKKKATFSKAAIETMAIIAYKQPITRVEIEEIRGAQIGNSLQILLERRLIKIDGRKNVVGHPLLYATTKEFLIYFGLKSLDALPTIKEIREMELK